MEVYDLVNNLAKAIKDTENLFLFAEHFSNKEIALMIGASEETVRRVKTGQVFKDEKLSYPLSNL